MKITKRQLRRIIHESIDAVQLEEIYLDHDAATSLGLPYDNRGVQHHFSRGDLWDLADMSQYDAAHQEIFEKYSLTGVDATGRGYGWWTLN